MGRLFPLGQDGSDRAVPAPGRLALLQLHGQGSGSADGAMDVVHLRAAGGPESGPTRRGARVRRARLQAARRPVSPWISDATSEFRPDPRGASKQARQDKGTYEIGP